MQRGLWLLSMAYLRQSFVQTASAAFVRFSLHDHATSRLFLQKEVAVPQNGKARGMVVLIGRCALAAGKNRSPLRPCRTVHGEPSHARCSPVKGCHSVAGRAGTAEPRRVPRARKAGTAPGLLRLKKEKRRRVRHGVKNGRSEQRISGMCLGRTETRQDHCSGLHRAAKPCPGRS